jgi:hypothetical protein
MNMTGMQISKTYIGSEYVCAAVPRICRETSCQTPDAQFQKHLRLKSHPPLNATRSDVSSLNRRPKPKYSCFI